jgi:hypothetical protein
MSDKNELKRPNAEQIALYEKLHAQSESEEVKADEDKLGRVRFQLNVLSSEYDWSPIEFTENGLKGLKNVKGEIEVPAVYDMILVRPECKYLNTIPVEVVIDGKIGIVSRDGTGRYVLEPQDLYIEPIYGTPLDIMVNRADPKHFAVSILGHPLTPFELEKYGNFYSSGIILLEANGKKGVLATEQGMKYIPPIYDDIIIPGGGEALTFIKDGKEGVVTVDGLFFVNIMDTDHCDDEVIGEFMYD